MIWLIYNSTHYLWQVIFFQFCDSLGYTVCTTHIVNITFGSVPNVIIFCSTLCFTSDHQTLVVYLRSDYMSLGVSIMTYNSRPLLRATYEVIIRHPSRIRWKRMLIFINSLQELNLGPFDRDSYALPLDQGCYPCISKWLIFLGMWTEYFHAANHMTNSYLCFSGINISRLPPYIKWCTREMSLSWKVHRYKVIQKMRISE